MGLLQAGAWAAAAAQENVAATAAVVLVLLSTPAIYNLYFHPLRHIPGPWLACVSPLFLYAICYIGKEGRIIRRYHQKYQTDVLRIAPNSVSVSDSRAVNDIYVTGGGFQKDERYRNFDFGPVVSIFSALDTNYRDVRAKAVAPLFSTARLRAASAPTGVIGKCVAEFVQQLQTFRKAVPKDGTPVRADILDLCCRLSIDILTGYALGQRYGGLHEHDGLSIEARQKQKLSANPFIFAIVAFSRFSLLPNRLFRLCYAISSRLSKNEEVDGALHRINTFGNEVVDKAQADGDRENSYQGRLMAAGISPSEVAVQSQAIVFAGADSGAVMLATILFHLVQDTKARHRLLDEVRATGSDVDSQRLPYLRAVVKEGLRLGMANPTRSTRVVGSSGLKVGDHFIPPGTIVGCAAYVLHHDPKTFPEPFAFRPERWLEDGEDEDLRRPEMDRSMLAFGVGSRQCLGKNLAMQALHDAVRQVVASEVLEGSKTCQESIELVEWFNAEIKGHNLEVEWQS